MNRKLRQSITFVVAGLLGMVAGFAKVTWAFIYSGPISFLAFDLAIFTLLAFFITLIAKEKIKLMVCVTFLPSLIVVTKIVFDGIKRMSFQNLPSEWSFTPFSIFLAALIGYKLGTAIKTRKLA